MSRTLGKTKTLVLAAGGKLEQISTSVRGSGIRANLTTLVFSADL